MFSLQPSDELVFAPPTTTQPYVYPQIPEYLIQDNPIIDNNFISFSSATSNEKVVSKTRNCGSPRPKGKRPNKNGSYDKRVMHRDVERKRREQASKLYGSLSALLPSEHNKGKRRSVSDQMEEAVSYIKQMHSKIQELRTRRDNLKKLQSSSSSDGKNIQNSDGSTNKFQDCVSVNRVVDGLEILITTKSPEFELSRVLEQVLGRDLDVVSCVSSKTKAGFLHIIDVKGSDSDMRSLDIWELQNKLTEAIK